MTSPSASAPNNSANSSSARKRHAEAVVFVHGNPGPADDWRDLLARAGELGRAIAPDMPGYGRAGKPCFVCGEPVRVEKMQRITYYCPRCQK